VSGNLEADLRSELEALREAGTYKSFLTLTSPQDAVVDMDGHGEVIVLSSNNYLGLSADPDVVAAGMDGLRHYGAGTGSVRFICGTFQPHHELERALADFLGTEAALTYVSCWNANEALIPSLTDERTVILSDALNHASIIDAIRLSRPARKVIYSHSNMDELREGLEGCEPDQRKLIITDGVFSMEGDLALLPEIVRLAQEHDAVVIVDDSHGTGVMGATGRGVHEHYDLMGEIDVLTGTLGKALGGAAGGYVAASAAVCDILAQRSRPQLFSNALPPTVACSALRAVERLRESPELVEKLRSNTAYFRRRITEAGFNPLPGEGAIVPIVVGETAFAIRLSHALLDQGVFVTGFGFPVVPEGTARIRVQMSAALTEQQIDRAVAAFRTVGGAEGVLPATG
jgi:glycine C-acetyltransferase